MALANKCDRMEFMKNPEVILVSDILLKRRKERMERINERLVKAELRNIDSSYYMSLVYQYDAEDGVHQVKFPKIRVPIPERIPCVSMERAFSNNEVFGTIWIADAPEQWIIETVSYEGRETTYIDELIEPAVHEMTVEEIEKTLGYKIKVVSEKGGIKS